MWRALSSLRDWCFPLIVDHFVAGRADSNAAFLKAYHATKTILHLEGLVQSSVELNIQQPM